MRFRDIISLCVVLLSGCTTHSALYEWEKGRDGLRPVSDMAICYGGHSARNPYLWTPERFSSTVSYVDTCGREHWLFDNMLMMEIWTDDYQVTYSIANDGRRSSDKENWVELLDYWFDDEYGFAALDECISQTVSRIGEPPFKRGVVFALPDPVYFEHYTDAMKGINDKTVYWGSVESDMGADSSLDFSKVEDRLKAYIWMVNQVRARFAAAGYRRIELIGFYVLSEELSFPGSFRYEYKEHDRLIPALADYCHSVNEALFWVPYAMAPGVERWREYGFDMCVMQPNIYWENPRFTWEQIGQALDEYGLGMELEFEGTHGEPQNSSILSRLSGGDINPYADANRGRFLEYLDFAREKGIYGTRPFVLYSGTDALRELAISRENEDMEVYHRLCSFIIENPLKDNTYE